MGKVLSLFTVVAFVSVANAAIFGVDNRQNLDANSPMQKYARATAVAVLTGNQTIVNSKLNIDAAPLSEALCKDERFSSEPSLSYACTGFLVAPDLLVTAGHCVSNHEEVKNEKEGYCAVFDWMFDYQSRNGAAQTVGISMDRVYRCKQIVYAIEEDRAPFRDFALVQLDRPVLDREPLKLSTAAVGTGDRVSMIGYPLGLPVKLTDGAKVIVNDLSRQAFVTNLDAFDGNSGSPVFNSTNEVVGILVAGTPSESWVRDEKKSCDILNRCDENGRNCLAAGFPGDMIPNFQAIGSDVQRVFPVSDLLKAMRKQQP